MDSGIRNLIFVALIGIATFAAGAFLMYVGGYEGIIRGRLPSFDHKWRRYYDKSPVVSRLTGIVLSIIGIIILVMGVVIFWFVVRDAAQSL